MAGRHFYLEQVVPQLDIPLADLYPQVSLEHSHEYHSLASHPLLMLVALTGTGKTTTLKLLREKASLIPSRREVADWIAIPMAQSMAGEAIRPVKDRVQRFRYTRSFAAQVSGGMARAFSWLNLADSVQSLILSEGIRGENEIRHALRCFPQWQIVELAIHPLTRLKRLSARNHHFDRADGDADLSFLPRELQAEAGALLKSGLVSPKALAIVRAEAANYGLHPFAAGAQYQNYHRVEVDDCSPQQVADAVCAIMRETTDAKH